MTDTITLADGTAIPTIGLGTLRMGTAETDATVRTALETGYRLIDTAACYGNERAIGATISSSGLDREDIFLTTKVWNTDHGYQPTLDAFEASRSRLGLDYVDLYLIHWPVAPIERMMESWAALIELRKRGDVRAIGVSNFMVKHLQALVENFDELPVLNQIECHPLFLQPELEEFQHQHGIITQAWAPLGKGQVLESPVVTEIAARHGATPAQVVLRWHLQRGRIAIPKSTNSGRIAENFTPAPELSEPELAAIDAMNADHRLGSHPDSPPTNGLPEQ